MIRPVTQGIASAILCLLLASPSWGLSVSVDRPHLTAGDSATLTLEIVGDHQQAPDLSALQQDFSTGGVRRSSVAYHRNGRRDTLTRWQVPIRPRNSGLLTIPALEYQGQQSQPIQLQVSGQVIHERVFSQSSDLFIDLTTDRTRVYQNAQLLLTVDIYHLHPLPPRTDIMPPYLEQGQVRSLFGPATRSVELNRQPYLHTQLIYALFPAEDGFITIEGPVVQLPEDDSNPFPITELLADNLEIEVLPQAHTTAQNYWLPAERLFVEDHTRNLDLGDRYQLLRQVRLTAVGLTSDRLPTPLLDAEHYDHYTLVSSEVEEHLSAQGVISVLNEIWLLTPEAPGSYVHPGMDLHWWNTRMNRAEFISHVDSRIEIEPQQFSAPTGAAPARALSPEPQTSARPHWLVWLMTALVALISMGWLYTWYFLRQSKAPDSDNKVRGRNAKPAPAQPNERPTRNRRSQTQTATPATPEAETRAYEQLARACQRNSAATAHSALLHWAQHFWPQHGISSVDGIFDAARSQTLNFLILDLQHHLFNPDEGKWQGDLLLEAVTALRRRRGR